MSQRVFCEECGHPHERTVNFCRNCGHQINPDFKAAAKSTAPVIIRPTQEDIDSVERVPSLKKVDISLVDDGGEVVKGTKFENLAPPGQRIRRETPPPSVINQTLQEYQTEAGPTRESYDVSPEKD